LVFVMHFLGARDLRAQSIGGMLVNDVRYSAGDAWDVWTSPFEAPAPTGSTRRA
jgi:hypothetical protein